MTFAAVLDTSVLWPSLQRDFLLSLAAEGMYRPLWSRAILAELEYHEALKRRRRGTDAREARERSAWLVSQMRAGFDDSEVEGWEPLEGTYGLPDPDDEHVVAAAHIGGAGVIVTSNLRDFPPSLLPSAIRVTDPANFANETVELAPPQAVRAVLHMAARSGKVGPHLSPAQVLTTLEERYGMAAAVRTIRRASSTTPLH